MAGLRGIRVKPVWLVVADHQLSSQQNFLDPLLYTFRHHPLPTSSNHTRAPRSRGMCLAFGHARQGCVARSFDSRLCARAHRRFLHGQHPLDHRGDRGWGEPSPGRTQRSLPIMGRASSLMQDRLRHGVGRHERNPRSARVVAVAREGLTNQHGRRWLHVPAPTSMKAALPDRQLRDPIALEHNALQLQGQLANLFGCYRRTSQEVSPSFRWTNHWGKEVLQAGIGGAAVRTDQTAGTARAHRLGWAI
jgi:hypothetical protein